MTNYLPCIELDAPDATASVIWLHGLGADGNDFVPIVNELGLPENHRIRFIFPHAPQRPITVNAGVVMRGWYDIRSMQIEQHEDEEGIRQSAQQVMALIDHEQQRGIASEKILLAGFSQGGAIALHTALRYAKPLAGLLALSTYLPLVNTLADEKNPANEGIPILLAHGTHDPIVPYQLADDTKYYLEQQGYQPELHSYPMQHAVCMEEIATISGWIQKVLNLSR